MAQATLRVWYYTVLLALTLNGLLYTKFAQQVNPPIQATFVQVKIEKDTKEANPKPLEEEEESKDLPARPVAEESDFKDLPVEKPQIVERIKDKDRPLDSDEQNVSSPTGICVDIRNRTVQQKGKTFKMLWYDPIHGGLYPEAKRVQLSKCEYNNCVLDLFRVKKPDFKPRTTSLDADAILFDGSKLVTFYPPKRRDTNQSYIFVNFEPPAMHHTGIYKREVWQNAFNWTMTHRMDSDILYTYGKLTKKKNKPRRRDYHTLFRKKKKQALWLVNSCDSTSGRNKFVAKLQEYINVDTFGQCSPNKISICSLSNINMTLCLDRFVKYTYKFYLSMENSFCKDYLSEKVYRWYNKDVIPVVRGTASKKSLLPPGTYIDTDDFPTIEELGKYLQTVSSNETLFVSYLKEKDKYNLKLRQDMAQSGYCEICKRLNHIDCFRKSQSSIASWWNKGVCRKATDLH